MCNFALWNDHRIQVLNIIKMVHPSIQQQLPLVIELFKNHKIKNAYVFGSAVTNKFNENSDVDFLINFVDG